MKKEKKSCDGIERKGSGRERSEGDERGRRTRLEGEEINPLSLMTQLMQQFMPRQLHGRQERKRQRRKNGGEIVEEEKERVAEKEEGGEARKGEEDVTRQNERKIFRVTERGGEGAMRRKKKRMKKTRRWRHNGWKKFSSVRTIIP